MYVCGMCVCINQWQGFVFLLCAFVFGHKFNIFGVYAVRTICEPIPWLKIKGNLVKLVKFQYQQYFSNTSTCTFHNMLFVEIFPPWNCVIL